LSLGIVYHSDAIASGVGAILPIDPALHDPIRYPMARVSGRDIPASGALMDCLSHKKAAAIFERYGFSPLDE
jgi:molybdate transport system substrate-binding protein